MYCKCCKCQKKSAYFSALEPLGACCLAGTSYGTKQLKLHFLSSSWKYIFNFTFYWNVACSRMNNFAACNSEVVHICLCKDCPMTVFLGTTLLPNATSQSYSSEQSVHICISLHVYLLKSAGSVCTLEIDNCHVRAFSLNSYGSMYQYTDSVFP